VSSGNGVESKDLPSLNRRHRNICKLYPPHFRNIAGRKRGVPFTKRHFQFCWHSTKSLTHTVPKTQLAKQHWLAWNARTFDSRISHRGVERGYSRICENSETDLQSAFTGCFWFSTIGICRMSYRHSPDVFPLTLCDSSQPQATNPSAGLSLQCVLQSIPV